MRFEDAGHAENIGRRGDNHAQQIEVRNNRGHGGELAHGLRAGFEGSDAGHVDDTGARAFEARAFHGQAVKVEKLFGSDASREAALEQASGRIVVKAVGHLVRLGAPCWRDSPIIICGLQRELRWDARKNAARLSFGCQHGDKNRARRKAFQRKA